MDQRKHTAILELKHRGLVPPHCVDGGGYHCNPAFDEEDEDGNPIMVWTEPIPGSYVDGPARYDGVHARNEYGIPYYDHGACMVEVHRWKGIEFHMTRVLFSQPYCPVHQLRASVQDVRERLDLVMTIVDDLAWYNPSATLCVYTPATPVPFDAFRRTFRFWLIVNIVPSTLLRPHTRLRDILPAELTPPNAIFFDLLACCDRSSVMLGLHDESVEEAWNATPQIQEWIEYDTFAFLWTKYRSSLYNTTILAVLFVAKLRAGIADRASYAPGAENHRRLVSQWTQMMDAVGPHT
jgi:hypothetical protein